MLLKISSLLSALRHNDHTVIRQNEQGYRVHERCLISESEASYVLAEVGTSETRGNTYSHMTVYYRTRGIKSVMLPCGRRKNLHMRHPMKRNTANPGTDKRKA